MDFPKMPDKTKEIFKYLIEGNFIVDNETDLKRSNYYKICDENYEILKAYFEVIGYELYKGDGYFILNAMDINNKQKESKINHIKHIIRLLNFVIKEQLFPNFDSGLEIERDDFIVKLAEFIKNDANREKLKVIYGKNNKDEYEDVVMWADAILKDMINYGIFHEIKSNNVIKYRCTSAINYYRELISKIKPSNNEQEGEKNEQSS